MKRPSTTCSQVDQAAGLYGSFTILLSEELCSKSDLLSWMSVLGKSRLRIRSTASSDSPGASTTFEHPQSAAAAAIMVNILISVCFIIT